MCYFDIHCKECGTMTSQKKMRDGCGKDSGHVIHNLTVREKFYREKKQEAMDELERIHGKLMGVKKEMRECGLIDDEKDLITEEPPKRITRRKKEDKYPPGPDDFEKVEEHPKHDEWSRDLKRLMDEEPVKKTALEEAMEDSKCPYEPEIWCRNCKEIKDCDLQRTMLLKQPENEQWLIEPRRPDCCNECSHVPGDDCRQCEHIDDWDSLGEDRGNKIELSELIDKAGDTPETFITIPIDDEDDDGLCDGCEGCDNEDCTDRAEPVDMMDYDEFCEECTDRSEDCRRGMKCEKDDEDEPEARIRKT